ncbi:MAG: SAM-dependent methyltransferase [Gemmatimonadales bacterium]|nr:SAM-dependent methyltransferase [Gemmatimonadales bacterium]NIN13284.1 SAM-dependent methyltransferase [Gemmatimonadales bacterium]NIQ99745.1 SAM-dependent methyltransferase [Gemmatimonadales bacterium]NIS64242.1 SAM-dependent methyltransferase [Gemmatimonadales bacterium]
MKPKPTTGRRRRASHTAAKVARGVVFLARDPVHAALLPEGAADTVERLSLAAGALKPWMCRLFETRWYRWLVDRALGRLWPGELMRLTLRKRFVDDEVRAAISDGARQVLIVGAGFDALGLRMAEVFPEVTVVEVDTPATAARRRSAIERMGALRANLHVVGADLGATSLGEVLRAVPAWQTDARTVAVAEGVVMYLDRSAVGAFLGEIRDNAASGSRLVFSYLRADQQGRPYMGRWSALSRLALRLVGEPLRWGAREGELDRILAAAGFRLLGPPERFDLRQRYLAPAGIDQPVGQVERFVVAEAG